MMWGVSKLDCRAMRHGSCAARKSVICSADFIKCAGERKPHFIKCGFGEAAFCDEIAMRGKVAC
jgi:hypothetical protein